MKAPQTVLDHLKANVHRPVRVGELADIACLSPIQLYRVFKSEMGLTPVQYHEQLRIKKGIELLQSEAQVRQVAYRLGYENYETFTRAFKRIVELSPNDLQTIYYRFSERTGGDYAVLVKEQESLTAINDLVGETLGVGRLDLDLEVYRISFQTKKKWSLYRDRPSEDALQQLNH
ncbi:MAG: AraC family transcriptional regulator [Bacteroidota bacterium]